MSAMTRTRWPGCINEPVVELLLDSLHLRVAHMLGQLIVYDESGSVAHGLAITPAERGDDVPLKQWYSASECVSHP